MNVSGSTQFIQKSLSFPPPAADPQSAKDSGSREAAQEEPDTSRGPDPSSLELADRGPSRHAQGAKAGGEVDASQGHPPRRSRGPAASGAAADPADLDFLGYSPCSSESDSDLFTALPPFRPEVFLAKGAVAPGVARSPHLREYRIRTEHEEILRRLATSLDRAKIQMESLPASPRFAFDIPAPETLPSERIAIEDLPVGLCAAQGRRPTMEDTHIAAAFNISIEGTDYPCRLFGIFDGHGGSEAARFVKFHIQQVLQELIPTTNRTELSSHGMYNALKLLGVRLSEEFNQKAPHLRDRGTTLSIALILNGLLWTANIGDSRIILANGGTAEQLTEDQKPGDPYYTKQIIARGGSVRKILLWDGREIGSMRTNGTLATARAIGDASCLPAYSLSSRAKITFKRMDQILPESFLILVCDGITDVASTQQIVEAIHANRTSAPEDLARGLSYSTLRAGSRDNLSSMVVRLR